MALNLDELQDQINEFTQQLVDANIKRVQEIRSTGQVSVQLDNQIKDLTIKLKNLTDTQKKLDELTKTLTASFISLGSTLLNVSNDITKFSPVVKGVVSSAGTLASGLANASNAPPIFVKSIEFATKAAEMFADSLVKYTETIVKAYDATASIGAAAGITSIELEGLGRRSRFSGDDLKVFSDIVKKQGSTLVALGGGVAGGVEAFANFVNVGEDQLKKYRMLGISQTQLAEYQGQYASSLIRSGISLDRSESGQKKLQEASLKYRDVLYALSSLSGDTVEQQQKAMEFQEQHANFQALMTQRDIEQIRLQEELDRNSATLSAEERAKRQSVIDVMKMQNDAMRVVATEINPEKLGIKAATAIMTSFATEGRAMTEDIAAVEMGFNQAGLSMTQNVRDFFNFEGTLEEAAGLVSNFTKDLQVSSDAIVDNSNGLAALLGSEYLEVYGSSVERLGASAVTRRQTEEERLAVITAAFAKIKESADGTTDPVMNLQSESEELARNFRDVVSIISANVLPSLTGFASKTLETGNALYEIITGVSKKERNNEVSGAGISGLGAAAIGALGVILAPKIVTSLARRVLGGTPGAAAAGAAAAGTAAAGTATRSVIRPNIPAGHTVSPGGIILPPGTSSVRPPAPAPAPGRASKFTRLVQAVGKKYGPKAALKLAAQAGLMAVPGPGWILALINLGFNVSLALGIYQIWKEVSGSTEDTSEEDTITENAIPISSMSAATNELTQSLAQLTGTNTEVGTIPTLTNSFDDLISTTDMLIEAFGSLRTSISSNNIATSTTSRSSGTGSANTQTASTTSRPSDTGTINVASMQSALSRYMPSYAGTNVSEQETKDFIIGNEGIRYEPYEDTLGNWTVGVGHLIGKELPPEMNRRFSHQEVMDLFDSDYMHHRNAAERIPGFNRMDGLGQTALTDLTFNMGPSWINGWPNLANQLGEGDIPSAADNLRNSRWYDQVGNRGPRVANMLEDSTMISAAQGGIASGPETGYLGKLHGTELIQPINSDSVLSKLATTPESTSDANINSNEIQTRMSEMYRSNMMLVETLNSKLDSMISKLEDGNYIQERILSNTV